MWLKTFTNMANYSLKMNHLLHPLVPLLAAAGLYVYVVHTVDKSSLNIPYWSTPPANTVTDKPRHLCTQHPNSKFKYTTDSIYKVK